MSVPSSLFIFLLWLSMHECNARRLAAIDKQEKEFHVSNQKEISGGREVESSLSFDTKVLKDESYEGAILDEKRNKNGRPEKKVMKKNDEHVSKGSVSWVVPKPKKGEKNPGFNSDYSPPKTHPPSHN